MLNELQTLLANYRCTAQLRNSVVTVEFDDVIPGEFMRELVRFFNHNSDNVTMGEIRWQDDICQIELLISHQDETPYTIQDDVVTTLGAIARMADTISTDIGNEARQTFVAQATRPLLNLVETRLEMPDALESVCLCDRPACEWIDVMQFALRNAFADRVLILR